MMNQRKSQGLKTLEWQKQRFERVTKNLKVTRAFSTLVEEMKAVGKGESQISYLRVPVALSERSPVLLLMGGGLGLARAVIKDILKESFWSGAVPVIVEADAFKESDVMYRAISAMGHHDDMLQTAELVHQSTDAASLLIVTALNEGRDVILDGTMSWQPSVEQTIAMACNVHKYRKPYRIELVGVVCDAYLAVVRGIRRAIMTGRAVRVSSQLKSDKRFARAFTSYCQFVDSARLYCTNAVGGPHRLIACKDGNSKLLIDTEEFKCLTNLGSLNPEAESICELYADPSPINESGLFGKTSSSLLRGPPYNQSSKLQFKRLKIQHSQTRWPELKLTCFSKLRS